MAGLALLVAACQSPPSGGVVKEAPSASAGVVRVGSQQAGGDSGTGTGTGTGTSAMGGALKVVAGASDMDALSQIRTARLEAKAQGRVLVVYVGATWCEPCKKMKAEIEAGRLDAKLGKTTLLAFDADKDQERLATIGYTFRYVPYVALPGADGQPADSAQATGKGGQAWRELLGKLEEWQAR